MKFLLASLALLIAGCASYEPVQLDRSAAWAALERVRLSDLGPDAGVPRDGRGLTGEEAAVAAILLNPELRVFRARKGVAEAMLVEAGEIENPELEVMGLRNSDGWMSAAWAALDVTEALLARGLKVDKAELEAKEAGWEVADREWRLTAEVRNAHIDAMYAAEASELNASQRRIALRSVELVQARVGVGTASGLDLTAAELELAELDRRDRRLEGDRRLALQKLNRLIGLPPDHPTPIDRSAGGLRFQPPAWDLLALRARLPSSRLDALAAEVAYLAAEKSLQLAYRRRWPSLRIGPAAEREDGMTSFGLGVMVELPFLNWNGGEIAVRTAEREVARREYEVRLFQARAEFDRARVEWETVGAELEVMFREVAPRLDTSLDLAERAFAAGQADVLQVLQLQGRVLDLKREILSMLRDWHHAAIEVEAAAGPEERR